MFLIEEENAISKKYLDVIDSWIMGVDFPWHFQTYSTSTKFPFFGHDVIPRYDKDHEEMRVNSKAWDILQDIFEGFCIQHGLKIKQVLRCALNLTMHSESFPHSDPHVDHRVPHYNMIMYFNTCSRGSTIIFKERDDSGKGAVHSETDLDTNYTIETEIKPTKGKIVVFDGRHFHANRFCVEPERRVVCVITFIPEKYE
jgi:hypothetical protein